MTTSQKNNLYFFNSDEPVDPSAIAGQIKDDHLGYDEYVNALKELAINCETPTTIGIHGRWGAGKTSLMKKIEYLLKDKDYVRTVWFNPWMFQFEESPLIPLLHEIRNLEFVTAEKVKRKGKQLIEKLIGSITFDTAIKASLTGAVLTGIVPPFLSPVAKLFSHQKDEGKKQEPLNVESSMKFSSKISDKYFDGKTPMQYFVKNFQDAIDAVVGETGRLIVFVDDLDRCMPERVIKVLESIKLFLNAKKCVFFLAVDREIVETGIYIKPLPF